MGKTCFFTNFSEQQTNIKLMKGNKFVTLYCLINLKNYSHEATHLY